MKRILVTGVGAIIGYGILRSLRALDRDLLLVGADIYADAVGQKWADLFCQPPLTSSDEYLGWMEKVLVEHAIDLVYPGIEQDLHFYSDNRAFFTRHQVAVVLNNPSLVDLTRDKWLMDQELAAIGSGVRIPSRLGGSFSELSDQLGLPFILKPRCGYASKGLVRVEDEQTFARSADDLGHRLLAQPIVGSDEHEYTVGVFCHGDGDIGASVIMRRKLAPDGSTAKAWVESHPDLDREVASLCAHFKPVGPTNFQFRRCDDGWKLLEINPRISSSTSLRTAFGYNESGMCLDFFLDGRSIHQPALRAGFAARYIDEVVVYDRSNF